MFLARFLFRLTWKLRCRSERLEVAIAERGPSSWFAADLLTQDCNSTMVPSQSRQKTSKSSQKIGQGNQDFPPFRGYLWSTFHPASFLPHGWRRTTLDLESSHRRLSRKLFFEGDSAPKASSGNDPSLSRRHHDGYQRVKITASLLFFGNNGKGIGGR